MTYKSLFALVALASAPAAWAAEGSPSFGVAAGGYFTDELQAIGDTVSIHLRGGYWINPTTGFELDLGLMPFGKTQVGTPDLLPYFGATPRVNLVGRVFEDKPLNLLLSVGVGAIMKSIDDPNDTLGLPTQGLDVDLLGAAGPGFFVPIGQSGLGARTDLHWLLNMGTENWENRGDQFLDLEWTAGLHYLPPVSRDADKDGIIDDDDACPDLAEDLDNFEDSDGCPEADNDKDGVIDAMDECPNDAEDLDQFDDADGCPDPDNDGDSVLDTVDNCPLEKGTAATGGCPDTDGDGLIDTDPNEECPTEAGPKESFGCPDKDGDLVPDVRDNCPDEKANEGINPKMSNGCPSVAYVTDGAIKITEKVQFDTGKATIKPVSHSLLDNVASLLTEYKGIKKVNVEGHTDDQGKDENNLALSKARAESVVKYLVGKGIVEERLVPVGFGETKPIADNKTAAGRETNRRVEFNIDKEDIGKGAKKKLKESGDVDGAPPAEDKAAPPPPKPEPKVEEKKAEEPKAEEKKAEEPKPEAPKAEEPKPEAPKAEEPKAEEPKPE